MADGRATQAGGQATRADGPAKQADVATVTVLPVVASHGSAGRVPDGARGAPGLLMERGRLKAHRPLDATARAAAVARGLAAYGRGEFYLAHEEMEPAWMGSDDPGERALLSGLIKLSAGFVHAARGNPAGVRTNLLGARDRLRTALELRATAPGIDAPIDTARLIVSIDAILAGLPADRPAERGAFRRPAEPAAPAEADAPAHAVAGPPSRHQLEPLDIEPPGLFRSLER